MFQIHSIKEVEKIRDVSKKHQKKFLKVLLIRLNRIKLKISNNNLMRCENELF